MYLIISEFSLDVSFMCAKSFSQTLWDPLVCSPPCPLLHGILQARILEWVAMPPPGDLPNPGIEPRSPALQMDSLSLEPPGKPKNTRVGSLSLLHGIFPTQESNWGLLHCRQILYQLSYEGSPPSTHPHPKKVNKEILQVLPRGNTWRWTDDLLLGHPELGCMCVLSGWSYKPVSPQTWTCGLGLPLKPSSWDGDSPSPAQPFIIHTWELLIFHSWSVASNRSSPRAVGPWAGHFL